MATALTSADINALCEKLRLRDIQYAESLDLAQSNFLNTKPRIKNWQEFRAVEDIKRAMIGLHEKTESVSVNVNGIEVTFVKSGESKG